MKEKIIKTVVFLLLSVLCMQIDAQTVIRERVKIKPSRSTTTLKMAKKTDQYLPCSQPYPQNTDSLTVSQVVWAGDSYSFDPGQQPLWYQSIDKKYYLGGDAMFYTYDIDVITGENLVEFHQLTNVVNEYGDVIEIKDSIIASQLKKVNGGYLRGFESNWSSSGCYDYNGVFQKYKLKFKPDVSGIVKLRYRVGERDSFFVETYVVKPLYHLSQSGLIAPTYHNFEYQFSPYFILDQCSSGCMPMNSINELCEYEIITGGEYGMLYNNDTKEGGASISSTPNTTCFIANGNNPKDSALVTIRVTPNSAVQPVDISFYVKHYEGITPGLNVFFSKTDLAAGDTVNIVIKKYYQSSWTENGFEEGGFNWGTTFEVGIKEGCDIGEILTSDGRKGTYFRDLQQPIKFIVGQSMSADSALLSIRAAADEPKAEATKIVGGANFKRINNSISFSIKAMNKTSRTTKKETSCSNQEFYLSNYRIAEVSEVVHPILLGETKYYGLKQRTTPEKTEYKIEEITSPYLTVPKFPAEKDDWKWTKIDEWGENPVTKISGTESVVYWEKKGPDSSSLPAGIIRIIGRYWVNGIMQKVKLSDQYNRAALQLAVKKPGKLGMTAPIILDVFNNSVNINDLCIDMGGKNGIPPQLIKGQMEEESSFRNAYRYEPFKDIYYQTIDLVNKKNMFDTYGYFKITETSTGTVAIPTHHNVKPVEYPGSTFIKDYLCKNIMEYVRVIVDKKKGIYKAKTDIIGYSDEKPLEDKLRDSYNQNILTVKKKKNETLPYTALKEAADTLKLLIQKGKLPGSNLVAQTRIVASYGLLQQTYYNAADYSLLGMGYENPSKPPEILNEISNSRKAYEERIEDKLDKRKHNNWTEGFEKGWIKVLSDYNGGGYSRRVSDKSMNYLPTNN